MFILLMLVLFIRNIWILTIIHDWVNWYWNIWCLLKKLHYYILQLNFSLIDCVETVYQLMYITFKMQASVLPSFIFNVFMTDLAWIWDEFLQQRFLVNECLVLVSHCHIWFIILRLKLILYKFFNIFKRSRTCDFNDKSYHILYIFIII